MILENNSSNVTATYAGFAMFLNLKSDFPTCVCFLRRKDESLGAVTTIQFRLIKNHNDGNNWLARNAFLLTIRSRDRRTLIHKMILTKTPLSNEELNYLKGYIRMTTGGLRIPKNIYELTKKYLNKEQIITENPKEQFLINSLKARFEKYFENNGIKDEAAEALINLELHTEKPDEFIVISYNDKQNRTWFKHSPLLTSWLRKNELA